MFGKILVFTFLITVFQHLGSALSSILTLCLAQLERFKNVVQLHIFKIPYEWRNCRTWNICVYKNNNIRLIKNPK